MSDPLAPQTFGLSLTDLLLVGAVVLIAVIYLYQKLRPRPGKPMCGSCPSERQCPRTSQLREKPSNDN
jgi:hypothetical protein